MFKPKFCPNKSCKYHNKTTEANFIYVNTGFYQTKTFGRVQRYRCNHCRKTFSQQTFSIDYYCKRKVNYEQIEQMITSSSGVRDIARDLGENIQTIQNRTARLARQYLALHSNLRKYIVLQEDLAADGIENFCYSQYHPNNIHLLVGSVSQYTYYFDHVLLRRKGRMTPAQKQKRALLESQYKADPGAIKKAFLKVLENMDRLKKKDSSPIILSTDESKHYERALQQFRQIKNKKTNQLIHRQVNSRKYRNYQNILFPCNYMDREIRKDLADFTRETVQFGRNPNFSMNRMAIFLGQHNYKKVFRIKNEKRDRRTHAEMAGIPDWAIKHGLMNMKTRSFLSHLELNEFEETLWRREIEFPIMQSKHSIAKMALE